MTVRSDEQNRQRLRLMYGLDQIEQDADDGTWWIGSELRPQLLNLESLQAAADYLDSLPDEMTERFRRPRGAASEAS